MDENLNEHVAHVMTRMGTQEKAAQFVASVHYGNDDQRLQSWTDLVFAAMVFARTRTVEQWHPYVGSALTHVIYKNLTPKRRVRRVHAVWFLVLVLAIGSVVGYYELTFVNTYR